MRAACFVLGLACIAVASAAEAESARPPDTGPPGPECEYAGPDVTPVAGDIPANWPVFEIGLTGRGFDATSARLVRERDGYEVPLFHSYASSHSYAPTEALGVGDVYALHHPICTDVAARVSVFVATEPLPAPSMVGAFEVHGPYAANRERGVANRFYFFVVTLSPEPLFDGPPWSLFRWVVEVDGDPSWAHPEYMSGRHERIGIDCVGVGGVGEGSHAIGVAAGPVPGFTPIRNESASTIDLRCDAALRVDADTLRALTTEEILYWDTLPMDAGLVDRDGAIGADMDGSIRSDGGIDGGRMDMHTEPDTNSNCSVSVPRSTDRSWVWPMTAVLVWVGARVRARRRGTAPSLSPLA